MHEMRRILVYMTLFLIGTVATCAALYKPLASAFVANQAFNAMILGVLLVGIAVNVRQVLDLGPALTWLRAFSRAESRLSVETRPNILAPLQRLLTSVHHDGFRLPALTMRTLLDTVRLRLEESREISRYMTGLLIFLGLLGTFWGLLDTVDGVGAVIAGLTAGDDLAATFAQLKTDLQGPLAGMGTAFSSSLFGLGGALILGFFDLQAGHAQNRFYNHLEEWLSDLVHLPAASPGIDLDGERIGGGVLANAMSEHLVERVDDLLTGLSRNEEHRRIADDHMADLLVRINELNTTLTPIARGAQDASACVEYLARMQALLQQLRDETSAGRSQLSDELRREIRLLTRVIAHRDEASTGALRDTSC